MFWERKLGQWINDVKERANVPAQLALWDGQSYDFGTFDRPAVTSHVKSASAMPLLLDPSLDNLGEAYVKQKIDLEGRLSDIIDIAYALAKSSVEAPNALHRVARYFTHSKASDKKSIQYHYDVSNEFYRQWLDPNMVYSCAYFEAGEEDLARAQLKKIDHILTKIDLRPDQTLLDIGCGWGGLVIRAAQKFGARCVGVTLSQNQFDRITSVGMFEHVGRKNLPEYFSRVRNLLADNGVAMNHGITSTDPGSGETSHGGGEFIDKYVFPDGELPHISLVLQAMQEGGLEAFDMENLRRHYAQTLRIWSDNYEAATDNIRALIDEEKYRIWRVYLAGCAYAFENDDVAIFQIICRKAGSVATTLPWSRQYIYAGGIG